MKRPRPVRRGQALVEFSLLLPVFVALIVALIEFGQAWHAIQVLTLATREGARVAIRPASTETEVRETVEDLIAATLETEDAVVTLSLQSAPGTPDTVRATYTHRFVLLGPVLELVRGGEGTNLPGSVTLGAEAVMRNE